MGVNTKYYLLVGIKDDYSKFKCYKSKIDPDYIWDLKEGYTQNYTQILFKEYLPPNYMVISDGMCGSYSIVGKIIDISEYLDEIKTVSFSPEDLTKLQNECYNELYTLGIQCNKEDIKLHSFVFFS